MPESPSKPRVYTTEDRNLALAYLDVSRAFHESGDPAKTQEAKLRDAARRSKVPLGLLRDWASGGMESVIGQMLAFDGDLSEPTLAFAGSLRRPVPPDYLLDEDFGKPMFVPAHDGWEWMKAVFVNEDGPLYNEAHWHLQSANIGVVWTNVESRKGGKLIWGTCESLSEGSTLWAQARAECQIRAWFGEVPDFLITLAAQIAGRDDDRTFCSGCEHELLHAGIKMKPDGDPRTDAEGRPCFGIRRHDAEEFVDCAARYGRGFLAGQTDDLVAAANRRPRWTDEDIALACGRESAENLTDL